MSEETTKVEETTLIETQEAVVETTEPKPYYAEFGYEDEVSFKTDFETLKSLKGKETELEQKAKEWNDKFSILQEAEDPFAGAEEAAQLVAFAKKGIPAKVATEVIGTTREELSSNPLDALILAEAVKNPAKFKAMGKAAVEEAIREKYNLGDGEFTPTSLMKSDAFDAIDVIEKIKSEVSTVQNPYKIAQEQKAQSALAYQTRQQNSLAEAQKLASTLNTVEYKFGDESVSLQVSKEDIDAVLNSEGAKYLGYADTSTPEGKKAVATWVKDQILAHKFQSGEVGREIVKAYAAEKTKEAVKAVHNGQPKIVARANQTNKPSKDLTPAQKELVRRGLANADGTLITH